MGAVFGKINEETPKHEVLTQTAFYQVRRYAPILLAEVNSADLTGNPTGQEFTSMAFRTLARYIGVFTTPENQSKTALAMTAPVMMDSTGAKGEKLAMTAPVFMGQGGSAKSGNDGGIANMTRMAFVLPSAQTIDTAPTPTNPAVKLRMLPGRVVAVHVFSGRILYSQPEEKAKELEKRLKEDGYELKSSVWEVAGYNSPFTFPWLTTNEVMFELKVDEKGEPVRVVKEAGAHGIE
eukprot:comp7120_c0_seq1/m.2852 comp7120_c0_seq1/g.2852  ORF comp7120_c0_seq1/g.2852 comp7120_c0_seq1/m.2852 type:complete len:236 (-) comp7120_c0_seq1:15-722(-)